MKRRSNGVYQQVADFFKKNVLIEQRVLFRNPDVVYDPEVFLYFVGRFPPWQ